MYFDYPLESIHQYAFKAAEAVNCAADQGKFWETHDRLFAHQSELTLVQLKLHAAALGLDSSKFDACLENGKYASEIRQDMAVAAKLGVTATPSFGIGFTDSEDPNKVKVVRTLRGALPFNSFKTVIDGLLSQLTADN
ncbi:thioredoxin domain-containing protein [Acidobacteria bacterium AH-259-D05]|nr:thioredoxin domain-containing protein [Acidobacteria bacterium AH-259-D05]